MNQILKRQTSPFHYGSNLIITVFITILEQNRQNSCQSSTNLSEVNVKDTFTSHIDKKNIFDFLLTPYLYTFSLYEQLYTFIKQNRYLNCTEVRYRCQYKYNVWLTLYCLLKTIILLNCISIRKKTLIWNVEQFLETRL